MRRVAATSEETEQFETFLFEMDDVLEDFLAEATRKGFSLDYSVAHLDRLEHFLDSAQKSGADEEKLKNRAARYLGEVFRKHIGGRWELCLKDPSYLYFKLPVISGYASVPVEFCPIEIVANFLYSRKPDLLRQAVLAHEEFKKK